MPKRLSLILSFLILIPTLCFAWQGKVVGVSDGDTITVMHEGKAELIRLYGIDTPELHQDYGTKAKQFTADMVFAKTVDVDSIARDRYGRTVGIVTINGKALNTELLKAGMAWYYVQYCKASQCSAWQQIEQSGRAAKVGLWSMAGAVAPWEFRRNGNGSSAASTSRLAVTDTDPVAGAVYHGNVRSHVFHGSGCKDYDCKNCTHILRSKEEAIQTGYRPHSACVD